ncbi:hypothetical protein Vadar_005189 [Vaccinium darrowii]|uniref:Uncharacterized protein n=1 Tax=Vaccinium darrowii TaxID=229202 RepID=A0ACB7YBR6_9ERIC|nr:hypothetical protein Vadar_005189 [Vaccinium darrowii]
MGELYVEVNTQVSTPDYQTERNPVDAWLPITKSRKGNAYTSTFHLICSGIGLQALLLPFAFAALGWFWGIVSLILAFGWQFYTIWLLVHLHESESVSGTRYSRYLRLSIAAFGVKLGKLLAIFPVMYLSGGTCVLLIINAGTAIELLYQTMCSNGICNPKAFTGAECFLVFVCLAITVALFCSNLNSVAGVSFIGAITAVGYCTLIWVVSVPKGKPDGTSYASSMVTSSEIGRFRCVLTALGIIALAFRGHNVVLEIQGTMPSNPKHASNEPMWKGVKMSYLFISLCYFPLAIGGYWACGNKIPTSGGVLGALSGLSEQNTSKFVKGFIYVLIVISSLCSFQIYAMPVFDNLEFIYVNKKNKECPRRLRLGIRFFFGGLTYFIAVALPFLGSLAALLGGIALPLTCAYPCFMWIAIKKPRPNGAMWWSNLCLGCLGIVLSVLLVVAAVRNLVINGLDANFFNPH